MEYSLLSHTWSHHGIDLLCHPRSERTTFQLRQSTTMDFVKDPYLGMASHLVLLNFYEIFHCLAIALFPNPNQLNYFLQHLKRSVSISFFHLCIFLGWKFLYLCSSKISRNLRNVVILPWIERQNGFHTNVEDPHLMKYAFLMIKNVIVKKIFEIYENNFGSSWEVYFWEQCSLLAWFQK